MTNKEIEDQTSPVPHSPGCNSKM